MSEDLTPEKSKYTISEEERQRRRERALQLHAEGRLGGAVHGKKGGRPRKKRASEIVAEAAADNAEKILKALQDGLKSNQPKTRLAAAKQWLDIESKEYDRRLREERALESLPTEELIEAVSERFARLAEAGALDFIEGDFTDIGPAEELGPGESEELIEEGDDPDSEPARRSGTSPFSRRSQK